MSNDLLELRVAWDRHLGRSPTGQRWFDRLTTSYRDPARHYHGLHHVAWVVRHVTSFAARGLVDDDAAVVAAAFFHDAIYDTARSDNEAASGRLAGQALDELGWHDDRIRHVEAMIEATAGHDATTADPDTRALLAADLAVLAAEPARYDEYARAVRREYAHLGDRDWCTGRTAVLHDLLAHEHLFPPALGLDDWERRARANITAELAAMRG